MSGACLRPRAASGHTLTRACRPSKERPANPSSSGGTARAHTLSTIDFGIATARRQHGRLPCRVWPAREVRGTQVRLGNRDSKQKSKKLRGRSSQGPGRARWIRPLSSGRPADGLCTRASAFRPQVCDGECALRGGAYVATADRADFGTAPPAATAAGRKPASLTCSVPGTGPGGPEGRRRRRRPRGRSARSRAVRIRSRLGDFSRLLAQAEAPGHSPARRPQCPAFQVALLATGSATGTAASPRGLGREAGPASSATEGQSTNPGSPSKRAARGPAAICHRTTRRRPYGSPASAGQCNRSSAGPKLLPTSGRGTEPVDQTGPSIARAVLSTTSSTSCPPAWPFKLADWSGSVASFCPNETQRNLALLPEGAEHLRRGGPAAHLRQPAPRVPAHMWQGVEAQSRCRCGQG
jgi:hypothetical protein